MRPARAVSRRNGQAGEVVEHRVPLRQEIDVPDHGRQAAAAQGAVSPLHPRPRRCTYVMGAKELRTLVRLRLGEKALLSRKG